MTSQSVNAAPCCYKSFFSIDAFKLPFVYPSDRKKLPSSSGVYFATSANMVVYVGASKNIKRRSYGHEHLIESCIDRIAYYVSDIEDIAIIEMAMIEKYRPAGNKVCSVYTCYENKDLTPHITISPEIAQKICLARKQKGMSAEKLSQGSRIAAHTIYQIEKGRVKTISTAKLKHIELKLEVDFGISFD